MKHSKTPPSPYVKGKGPCKGTPKMSAAAATAPKGAKGKGGKGKGY